MGHINRTTIVCECCDQVKPWAERSEEYIWIDICDDCEAPHKPPTPPNTMSNTPNTSADVQTSTPTRTVQISYYETVRHTATIEVAVGPGQDIWDAAFDHLCQNPVETETESLGMAQGSFDVEPA